LKLAVIFGFFEREILDACQVRPVPFHVALVRDPDIRQRFGAFAENKLLTPPLKDAIN
jgi:hypothetical protein